MLSHVRRPGKRLFPGSKTCKSNSSRGSAAERDQIMAAGQADGMINDLISTLLYNKDDIQIQIVSFARICHPEFLIPGPGGGKQRDDRSGRTPECRDRNF
jgi:hypothetical protein